jgi:hypothetical protein
VLVYVDPHRVSVCVPKYSQISDLLYGDYQRSSVSPPADRPARIPAGLPGGRGITEPRVKIAGSEYRIEYAIANPTDPPLVIRNRPKQIVFNTSHPIHNGGSRPGKYEMSLALELAYLLDSSDAAAVYEQMVSFFEVL